MEEGAEGGEERQTGSPDALTAVAERDGAAAPSPRTPPTPEATKPRRLALFAPHLGVAVFGVWLTRSFWFPGRYMVGFDTYAYSGPNLEVSEAAIRNWHLPILNDLIFGGVPHLGNPSAAAIYPPQFVTLLFETNRAMGILVTAHVVLLGVGMVVLARRLGVGRLGAGVAGGALLASGATLTKTVQFEQILVIAWIPALLASAHAVLHSSRPWKPVAVTSVVTAAVLLAGHPQHVYQTVVLALGASIGFTVGGERWRRLPHLLCGAALGALIAAPQLVAVLYATADSALDGGRSRDELLNPMLVMQPRAAARALFGTIDKVDPAGFVGSFESIAFVGVVVGILALVGWSDVLSDPKRRSWGVSFGVVGLLALIWALGPRTVVFDAAFDLLPGFNLARGSARWLVIVVIVVSLLAGVGVDALVHRARSWHLIAAAAGVSFVALAFGAGRLDADRRTLTIWAIFATVAVALVAVAVLLPSRQHAGTVACGLLIGLAALELVAMSMHSIPQISTTDQAFTAHESPAVTYLQGRAGSTIALTDDGRGVDYDITAFRPNANVLAQVPSIDGYDGGVQITERWATTLQRFTIDPPTELPMRNSMQLPVTPRAMARLGVRYIMLDKARPPDVFIPGWIGPVAEDANISVWENPAWIGDAMAWRDATVIDDPVDTATALRTDDGRLAGTAIVDRLDVPLECTSALADECASIGLVVESDRPEHLVVRTDLAQASVVSVARQALPGWRVEIDGERAKERTVDGLFLGVEVPAGPHVVTWRYSSPWLMPSIVLSLLAIAATVGLAFADTVMKRAEVLK
jgi:hypothetical protein